MNNLELPRTEDLTEINRLKDHIEKLEYRNRKLKEYIKDRLDIDEGDMDSIEGFEEEMTPVESKIRTQTIERYEEYANSFNYGRGEKVAESL